MQCDHAPLLPNTHILGTKFFIYVTAVRQLKRRDCEKARNGFHCSLDSQSSGTNLLRHWRQSLQDCPETECKKVNVYLTVLNIKKILQSHYTINVLQFAYRKTAV